MLSDLTSLLIDPHDLCWRWLQPGGHLGYWRHPDWDRLMSEARHIHAREACPSHYKRAATILLYEVLVLCILRPETIFAPRKDLHWRGSGHVVMGWCGLRTSSQRGSD